MARIQHYDVLGGLKAMAELGSIQDERCRDALDLLESKRLPDGGWPAEARYYRHSTEVKLGHDDVDWGGTSARRMNEWITVDALAVMRAPAEPNEISLDLYKSPLVYCTTCMRSTSSETRSAVGSSSSSPMVS